MNDNETDKPPVDFQIHAGSDDEMVTTLVIRSEDALRRVVSLHAQWINGVHPTVPVEELPGLEEAGPDEVKRLVHEGKLHQAHTPALIIGHIKASVNLDDDEEDLDMRTSVFVVDPEAASNMLAGSLSLFVRDRGQCDLLLNIIGTIINGINGNDDEDED